MSWEDIETQVQRAIVKASGLPTAQVAWSYQDIDERVNDHIVITLGGEITLGMDRIKATTDLTRPNGQEIAQEIKGMREVPLELEFFTTSVYGETSARRRAEKTKTKLRLDSVREPLSRVGFTPFDPGPVQWVPDIAAAGFRGRAVCTIRCYVPVMDCIEYVGYIARIRGRFYPLGVQGPTFGVSGFAFDSLQASGVTGYRPY